MAKLELVDGQLVITQSENITPDTKKRPGLGSLLGGAARLDPTAGLEELPRRMMGPDYMEAESEGIPTRDMFDSEKEYLIALAKWYRDTPEGRKKRARRDLSRFEAMVDTAEEGGMKADRAFDKYRQGVEMVTDRYTGKRDSGWIDAKRQELKDAYEWSPSAGPEKRFDSGDYFPEYMYKKLPEWSNQERMLEKLSQNMNQGGRVGFQTGGVTESRVLPPEYIEALGRTYATDLTKQAGIPSITTAVAQQPGETAAQFAQRQAQAQQFGIRKAGMAELAPQVAAQDPYQAAAYAQAVDPSTGLGGYQQYLTDAGTAATAATGLTGTGAGTGAGSIASYMSPYQQQVIDATMADYDAQAAKSRLGLGAQAVGGGAFGSGRHGIAEAEFDALSNRGRAAQLANLRSTGFQQASQRRQQDLANQMGIANLQSGLGTAQQDFSRAQIAGLGTLGATQQAQNQAVLDAQRQASQMAVQDPINRLNLLGSGVTGLMGGMGQITTSVGQEAPQSSPLATALGVGLTGADIYSRLFRPRNA